MKRLIFLLLCAPICGCGKAELASDAIIASQQALDGASQAAMTGDYEAAMPLITLAIDGPGLDPDQYAGAVLIRARCYAEADNFEAAQADIAEAELGSPNDADLLATKSFLLKKQGRTAEAKKLISSAKRLDPSIKAY